MSKLNIKSSTIEKGLELVKDFLGKIVSPTIEELGLMISDNIKHRRLKNQINNLEKVRNIVESKGLTLKQVNLKVLFPYLEGIAVEEDETLQDMWANLFVNYIDIKSNLNLTVYPLILKQLSTKEVEILLEAKKTNQFKDDFGQNRVPILKDINESEINNLERLGLVKRDLNYIYRKNMLWEKDIKEINVIPSGYIILAEFGIDFIEACTLKENV